MVWIREEVGAQLVISRGVSWPGAGRARDGGTALLHAGGLVRGRKKAGHERLRDEKTGQEFSRKQLK